VKRALLAVAVAALLAGCGGDDDATTTETTTTTTPPVETVSVKAYWLRDGKVWPVRREIEPTEAVAAAALAELQGGPTDEEAADLGAETALPEGTQFDGVTITDGVARFNSSTELSVEAQAQVVYTLTQFSTVQSVEIDGAPVTRLNYEDQTPSVLVESPLPFDEVSSPLVFSGTANTFEATFSFEIQDSEGEIIASDFATATSGTGTRGTFDVSQPFVVDEDTSGALVVFEFSAEDGSRTREIDVPLELLE
jgi:hypothetical protein